MLSLAAADALHRRLFSHCGPCSESSKPHLPPPHTHPAAADQFLAAVQAAPGGGGLQVVGYCCGTLTSAGKLTEESMGAHEPEGNLLAVHSVCVAAAHRRRGVATRLLQAYLAFVQQSTPALEEVRLICKEPLIPLYQRAGLALLGPSDVVHGQDPWFEMAWSVPEEEEEEEAEAEAADGAAADGAAAAAGGTGAS